MSFYFRTSCFISSLAENSFPFVWVKRDVKRWKSEGAKSAEYAGWFRMSQLNKFKSVLGVQVLKSFIFSTNFSEFPSYFSYFLNEVISNFAHRLSHFFLIYVYFPFIVLKNIVRIFFVLHTDFLFFFFVYLPSLSSKIFSYIILLKFLKFSSNFFKNLNIFRYVLLITFECSPSVGNWFL